MQTNKTNSQAASTADMRRSLIGRPDLLKAWASGVVQRCLRGAAAVRMEPEAVPSCAPALPSTMPLDVLVELLQAADGPDTRLDRLIAIEVGNQAAPTPAYTSSVDAALTLIESGRDYELTCYGSGTDGRTFACAALRWWPVPVVRGGWRAESGNKLSPALAMCIAAMRVRLAKMEERVPLAELIERVKAAKGPDRDLDQWIAMECWSSWTWANLANYTGSVAAAMTLLERPGPCDFDPYDTTANMRLDVDREIWRMRHEAGVTASQFPHPALEICAGYLLVRQRRQRARGM